MIWSSPLTSAGNFPLTIFSLHTLRLRKRGYSRRQIDSKREHLNIATKFINGISNIMRLNEDPRPSASRSLTELSLTVTSVGNRYNRQPKIIIQGSNPPTPTGWLLVNGAASPDKSHQDAQPRLYKLYHYLRTKTISPEQPTPNTATLSPLARWYQTKSSICSPLLTRANEA